MGENVTCTFFFCLIIFLNFPSGDSNSRLAPALYVFGDSMIDNGNNNFLLTISRANYLPYGINFPKGATGRFTNGRTFADFIAEFLGLPMPPPYLSFGRPYIFTGLNYASGASGILPDSGKTMGKCISMDEQINFFENTVENELARHYESLQELSRYLAKSIFLVAMGSNDYFSYIFNTTTTYSPHSYAQFLIDQLYLRIQKLYRLGARKVVVFEIGPIGCTPYLTRMYKHNGQCVERFNKLPVLFNNQLLSSLKNWTSTLQGSTFTLGHANWITDLYLNPSKYGLKDTSNTCCVTFENAPPACVPNIPPCPNADEYFYWDGFHTTEILHSMIAKRCFNDTSGCSPLTLMELAQI